MITKLGLRNIVLFFIIQIIREEEATNPSNNVSLMELKSLLTPTERIGLLEKEIESCKTSRIAEVESLKRKHAEELLALKVNYEKEISLNKKKKWVNKLEFLNKICNECFLLSI